AKSHLFQRPPHPAVPPAVRDAKIPHLENVPQIRIFLVIHSMLSHAPAPDKPFVPAYTRMVSSFGSALTRNVFPPTILLPAVRLPEYCAFATTYAKAVVNEQPHPAMVQEQAAAPQRFS